MSMDTDFYSTKTLLTKLLAQENLRVEHRPGTQAFFDLETRTIVIPVMKEQDNEIYDLLIGHEIAHAIYTPSDEWTSSVREEVDGKKRINRGKQTFLNVIEDARIERLIKNKYPGLRRSFTAAYKKLNDMNFFGIKDVDVNKMSLIDRINLFYKLNGLIPITFTQDELKYLDEINAVDTFDDVKTIAEKLYDLALEKKNEQNDEDDEEDFEDNDSFDEEQSEDLVDLDDWMNGLEEDETDDETEAGAEAESDSEETEEVKEDDYEENFQPPSEDPNHLSIFDDDDEFFENDVCSSTDTSFRAMEKNLYEDVSVLSETLTLPNLPDNYFIPYAEVHKEITNHINSLLETNGPVNRIGRQYGMYGDFDMKTAIEKLTTEAYSETIKRLTPTVNYMVKEFEMRKNSKQLSRAKISKSGKIDTKKLYRFGFDSDIFSKMTTVDNGKNHGLVVFIDLSGSMDKHIVQTFEQAIALSIFCRKVNIPFEIYGFSNNDYYDYKDFEKAIRHDYTSDRKVFEDNDLYLNFHCFRIKQYLSSTMSPMTFKTCVKNMLYVAKSIVHTQNHIFLPSSERLYGTPLSEAILASGELVSKFKKNNNVHNVNCIFMTDGTGGNCNHKFKGNASIYVNDRTKVYIVDKKTGHRAKFTDVVLAKNYYNTVDGFKTSRAIIEIMKQNTGAKYTGYYIGDKRTHCISLYPYEYVYVNEQVRKEHIKTMMKKINDNGFLSSNVFGFNQYYFVHNMDMKINSTGFEVAPDASKNKIAKAFMKSMEKMNVQRMFLNRFMENISN